jgi:hypothetical protein
MRKIHVVCPICSASKRMAIPPEIFDVDQGYLLKIPIFPGNVCEHRFVAVLDYNFSIRDYETPAEKEFNQIFDRKKRNKPEVDFSFF